MESWEGRSELGIKHTSEFVTQMPACREAAFVFLWTKEGDRVGRGRCRRLLTEAAFRFSSSGSSVHCPLEVSKLLWPPSRPGTACLCLRWPFPPLAQKPLSLNRSCFSLCYFGVRLRVSKLMSRLHTFIMVDLGHKGCKLMIKGRLN